MTTAVSNDQGGFKPGTFVILHEKDRDTIVIGVVANNKAENFLSDLKRADLHEYNQTIVLRLGYFNLKNSNDFEYYNYGSIFSEGAGVCKFPFYDVLPTEQLIKYNPGEYNYFQNNILVGFINNQRTHLGVESPAGKVLRNIFYLPPEKVEVVELVSLLAHFIEFEGVIRKQLTEGEKLSGQSWVATSPKNQMKLWEQLSFLT